MTAKNKVAPRSKKAPAQAADKAEKFHIAHVRQDGVHLHGEGGLPINHRLRAEELVAADKHTDPDGLIADELIADTKARLAAEAEAATAAKAGEAAKAEEPPATEPPQPPVGDLADPPSDPAGKLEGSTDQ